MRHLDPRGYDVLIAGAGAGGATLGHALARAGRTVLFVEQGPDLSAPDALRGMPPEAVSNFRAAARSERDETLMRGGRNPEPYLDALAGDAFVPFVGFGTGGSSGLYGMVLERRRPDDFDGWPIGYGDLEPWYAEAERLYAVRGSVDPLRPREPGCEEPAVPLSPANQVLFNHLSRSGLHPYRLHLACQRIDGCGICQGYLCPSERRCKNDARVICLEPAIATGNARLLARTRVIGFEADGRRVRHAVLRDGTGEFRIGAKLFVLAAGALSTPRILLDSRIGGTSGLVGRRLMRHAIDLFVLAAAPAFGHASESKELGLNDYYGSGAGRLGTIQSFGMAPPLDYLRNRPGWNIWRLLGPAAAPISRLFANRPIVASILEDRPSLDNRVDLSGATPRIRYRLPPGDSHRRRRLARKLMRAFARFAPVPVIGTSSRPALGHVCGTALFGADPASSVLDARNRVHETANLFVADASFFPTSGGVNPALTIAANALRVADHIHREILG